jgi:hypothetical protein
MILEILPLLEGEEEEETNEEGLAITPSKRGEESMEVGIDCSASRRYIFLPEIAPYLQIPKMGSLP